jgi:predicted DNA-binding transcriptional regulator AlpA
MMRRKTDDDVLRPEAVWSMLAISKATLYRWVHIGHFPAQIRHGLHATGWNRSTVIQWKREKGFPDD